jgi:hypothetical protein
MHKSHEMEEIRHEAALAANADDASVWRWVSGLMEERRIRWCLNHNDWLISVDNRHVATEVGFDRAVRAAKLRMETRDAEGGGAVAIRRKAA